MDVCTAGYGERRIRLTIVEDCQHRRVRYITHYINLTRLSESAWSNVGRVAHAGNFGAGESKLHEFSRDKFYWVYGCDQLDMML